MQAVAPALRCVGNITTGTHAQIQAVLDRNAVSCVKALLGHSQENVRAV